MAADNTTEYKVIVDTEVTGGENMGTSYPNH
jgi:hypothetical protein